MGLATTGNQNNWNTILPLTDFVNKDMVTRWLALEINVASTDVEVRPSFQPLPWRCQPGHNSPGHGLS